MMVEFLQIDGELACFGLRDVPPERHLRIVAAMALLGTALSDGKITDEEADQLLALAYPDLAGRGKLAAVLQLSEEAMAALRDDGRLSLAEGVSMLANLARRLLAK